MSREQCIALPSRRGEEWRVRSFSSRPSVGTSTTCRWRHLRYNFGVEENRIHPLLVPVRTIARRARALVLYRGLAWFLSAVAAVAFAAGWLDYQLRVSERGLRVFLSAAVLTFAGWCLYRFVWPGLRIRRSDTFYAQMIERRFPALQDTLSSAIAFLRQPADDPRYGSADLRKIVVQDATHAIATLDMTECLDARSARRAMLASFAVILVVLAICALDVNSALLAAHRLVMPWNDEAWPRRNWLLFTRRPEKLATGEDFLVELKDRRGWLPTEVSIHYWFEGDREQDIRTHRMVYTGGKMTHRLADVDRSFRYRATGGDDWNMEWIRLQVVDAPRVIESRILLRPPAYTGIPEEQSERVLRGFAGTSVEFSGRTSKPISSATLVFRTGEHMRRDTAVVGPEGKSFHLPSAAGKPWLLEESGLYGWSLVDRDGVSRTVDPDSPIDVLIDQPPTATFENSPSSTRTAHARMRLRVLAKDDLALQKLVLRVNERVEPLFEIASPPVISISDGWPPRGEQRIIDHEIDLASIENLQTGDRVTIQVIASDFKPQDSLPAELVVLIIAPEEFKARLEQQQVSLLERLQEALRLQRTVRSQTKTWQDEWDADPLQTSWETVQGILLGQRRVRGYLEGDSGATPIVLNLITELQSNKIPDASLIQYLESLRQTLQQLSGETLPSIEEQLERSGRRIRLRAAGKSLAETSPAEADELKTVVAAAANRQDAVIKTLEEIVDRLSHRASYRTLAREVDHLQNDQQSLLADMQSLETAARDFHQLSAEEKARLKRTADHQNELAIQLDRLHQRLATIRSELSQTDPAAAEKLDRAMQVLDERSLGTRMRDVSRDIARNRVGSASRNAEQVLEGLQALKKSFRDSGEDDGAPLEQQRFAQQLRLAAERINQLAEAQRRVTDETRMLGQHIPRGQELSEKDRDASRVLAARQQETLESTRKLADEMKLVSALSRALDAIARILDRASESLNEGRLDDSLFSDQAAATSRLENLAQAFEKQSAELPESSPQDPEATGSKKGDSSRFSPLELQILRDWQAEISRGTNAVANEVGEASELTSGQRQRFSELAEEEDRLATLVQDLVTRAAATTETETPKSDRGEPPATEKDDSRQPVPRTPAIEKDSLDRQLFDDLPPSRTQTPPDHSANRVPDRGAAGEDLGQPPDPAIRLADVGRVMRQVESRLRQRDGSPATWALQQSIDESLARMIDELQPAQSGEQQARKQGDAQSELGNQNRKTGKESGSSDPNSEPNSVPGRSPSPDSAMGQQRATWASDVWGSLPDHVRQRFNNLGDERFLPAYEEIIQQYYDRLSERGRNDR